MQKIMSGNLFLLKIKNQSGNFEIVGGMKNTRFILNNQIVDVSNKSSGKWRKLLEDTAPLSLTISASGIFTDSSSEQIISKYAFENKLAEYQISFANNDSITGHFQITSYEREGNYGEEEIYSIILESSGEVTFTNNL